MKRTTTIELYPPPNRGIDREHTMDDMIEHAGIVESVSGGRAVVSVATDGCDGCSHGGGCAMNKLVRSGKATHLDLPAPAGLQAGDHVILQLPESRMPLTAVLGYLVPALAVLAGAGFGNEVYGSDGAAMLGALGGFLAAMAFARFVLPRIPGLLPVPDIVVTARADRTHLLSRQ
jgi:sigma-E factor negative regulatory protein RseC